MGDTCCNQASIGFVASRLEKLLGVYVHSIATGPTTSADLWSSYYGNVNDQVQQVCDELADIPELANGFNAIGFSQGGQFLRAVAERCQHTGPKMRTLVTFGAQHQGIMNVPDCRNTNGPTSNDAFAWCLAVQKLIAAGAYMPWVRSNVVQAQYFKDPYNLDKYLAFNTFLADINNEREVKNPAYASNLASLNSLVLVMFGNDTVVVPKESAWFGFFDGEELQDMEETDLYKNDDIGLRELNQGGRITFKECPSQHMQFSMDWFEAEIVPLLGRPRGGGNLGVKFELEKAFEWLGNVAGEALGV